MPSTRRPRYLKLGALLAITLSSASLAVLSGASTNAAQDHETHASDELKAAVTDPGQHGEKHPTVSAGAPGGHSSATSDGGYGGHGGWPEPAKLGGDFSLTDHTGRPVTMADFKGKPLVLFFGYSQCDDICPVTANKIGRALDLMGDKADMVQAAFISVDDRNDGPEELARFVANTHPRLIGLSGTRKQVYDVAARFRVRRDYTAQATFNGDDQDQEVSAESGVANVTETEEPVSASGPHATADHSGDNASAIHKHQSGAHHGGEQGSASAVKPVQVSLPAAPGQRTKIRSASPDAQNMQGMAMSHTTHIYLLSSEGTVVKYIYPSMSDEQLAKRLTALAENKPI